MNGLPPDLRIYSLEEVAEILSGGGRTITIRTLQDYCRRGVLRGVKVGATWRVSHASLSSWLNGDPPSTDLAEPAAAAPATGEADPVAPDRRLRTPPKPRIEAADDTPRTLADFVFDPPAAAPSGAGVDRDEPRRSVPRTTTKASPSDPVEEFWPSGALKTRTSRQRNAAGVEARQGAFEAWHENGVLSARGYYVDDQLDGSWEQWHPNGRPHVVGRHREGLQDGAWTWWDEDGNKSQEGAFERGRPHGLWIQFHANGRRWSEGRYRDGEPEGPFLYWDGDGRPI